MTRKMIPTSDRISQAMIEDKNTDQTRAPEGVEPPVRHLQDVPPEEWDYSNRQAFAGCGIVIAVFLGIFLPPTLRFFIDDRTANIIGFGFTAILAAVSVAVIVVLTRRKHRERRALDEASSAEADQKSRP